MSSATRKINQRNSYRMAAGTFLLVHLLWFGNGCVKAQSSPSDYDRNARRAAPRDAFPVFSNPQLVPANQAKGLQDSAWVIGVAIGKEARAYPVAVMGIHELGNDICGGQPIAVSW